MFAVLLFGLYPQAYFPQLSILATVVEGTAVGDLGAEGERFSDNKRVEGTLPLMLEDALTFVRKNMRIKTIIDPSTGKRSDKPEYPLVAVREAILNALVHRDYSIHTEGMPIQLQMFADRLEIRNPGGLYGRMTVDQLGKRQADTRNPNLAVAMEVLGITENRYSGIPTIQRELQAAGLAPAEFREERGSFVVVFYNQPLPAEKPPRVSDGQADWLMHSAEGQSYPLRDIQALERLLVYCETPRSREELAQFLQLRSVSYAIAHYITPLLQNGMLRMTIPDKPRSRKQQFVRSQD